MEPSIWLLQLSAGVANGFIYAALGLALVMIHRTTHHINFAQGEMATLSTYLAWQLIQSGMPVAAAMALTLVLSLVMGVVVQRVLIRPVQHAPALTQMMVFVGLLVSINAFTGWWFGHVLQAFPSPFPVQAPEGLRLWSGHQLGMVGVTLFVMALVWLFFRFTRLGLALRAAAQHPEAARWVGISVPWMWAWGWGLAAMLGALAGMLMAPVVYLEPNLMMGVLLYGFAAAVLGGMDRPQGAVLGGLLVGVIDPLLGTYVVGHELQQPAVLALVVAVLWWRPQGLLGPKAQGAA